MKFTPEELRSVTILEGLPWNDLAWFSEHGDKVELSRGDHMFEVGQPAEFMFIIVRGAIQRYETIGGQMMVVATTGAGEVTGMLPYSRMTHYPGTTVASEHSQLLRVRRQDFQEMLRVSQEMGRRLVAVMTDRVRGDVRLEQQRDRMAALGRLSAGLAHEINNPASAVRRAASGLAEQLSRLSPLALALMRHPMDEPAQQAIEQLRNRTQDHDAPKLTPLQRSDREDELTEWLEAKGVVEPWQIAEAFVDSGVTIDECDEFARQVPDAIVADALAWIGGVVRGERMAAEIVSSAARVSELIRAIKTYSHMDRSFERRPTDVREGLDNTLTMLSHKLKVKDIRVLREYTADLPPVVGNAGELNQVWTNLIDNAIDAMDDGGSLRLTATREGDWVSVRVIDDGHGMSDEIRGRIFEPFFTTKTVGEGTGLGLDIALRIVRTHEGGIDVQSGSSGTEMCVRLPVSPVARGTND